MDKSDLLVNSERDHLFRTTPFTKPTTLAIGLLEARIWQPSTAYPLNSYVVSTVDTPTGAGIRIYKATIIAGTGTSAASEPVWPVVDGGTVIDNTGANQITWTEQKPTMRAGTSLPEVANANQYARQLLNAGDANWTASGIGASDNVSAIVFPKVTTASWGIDGDSRVVGFFLAGTATHGIYTSLYYLNGFTVANRKDVNLNDQFQFAIGDLDFVGS